MAKSKTSKGLKLVEISIRPLRLAWASCSRPFGKAGNTIMTCYIISWDEETDIDVKLQPIVAKVSTSKEV